MRRIFVFAVVGLLCAVPRTEAAFLNGTVQYDFNNVNLNGGLIDFTLATTLVSLGGGTVGPSDTGDFEAFATQNASRAATVQSLTYAPPTPIANFVAFTGADGQTYRFSISAFNVNTINSASLVIINGVGSWTTTKPGYDPTAGGFTLTASKITNPEGGTSFQAGGTLSAFQRAVPEPTALVLLGAGLLGFAARRRRVQ